MTTPPVRSWLRPVGPPGVCLLPSMWYIQVFFYQTKQGAIKWKWASLYISNLHQGHLASWALNSLWRCDSCLKTLKSSTLAIISMEIILQHLYTHTLNLDTIDAEVTELPARCSCPWVPHWILQQHIRTATKPLPKSLTLCVFTKNSISLWAVVMCKFIHRFAKIWSVFTVC